MSRTSITAVALAAFMAAGGVASADLSRGVISNYRGQLVITKDELPEGKSDKDTITKINGVRLKTLEGAKNDDVVFWHFHYTAFLSKTGSSTLKLEFLKEDGKLAANQRLESVDTKSSALTGDISINEDDGLNAGKTYTVELLTENNTVVAKATLQMLGAGK